MISYCKFGYSFINRLFDIGGKKIDRRKWATMYDGIDAIFFLVALAEYNQYLEEQPTMVSSIQPGETLVFKF